MFPLQTDDHFCQVCLHWDVCCVGRKITYAILNSSSHCGEMEGVPSKEVATSCHRFYDSINCVIKTWGLNTVSCETGLVQINVITHRMTPGDNSNAYILQDSVNFSQRRMFSPSRSRSAVAATPVDLRSDFGSKKIQTLNPSSSTMYVSVPPPSIWGYVKKHADAMRFHWSILYSSASFVFWGSMAIRPPLSKAKFAVDDWIKLWWQMWLYNVLEKRMKNVNAKLTR